MRKISLVLLSALILMSIGLVARAGDGIPDNCEYKEAAYYQPNISPRYERENRRLVLVDWNTGKIVKTLETSFEAPLFRVRSWSPDCRYLYATTGYYGSTVLMEAVWDVITGKRVHEFAVDAWDPSSQYALVCDPYKTDKSYVWQIDADQLVPLAIAPDRYSCYWDFRAIYWDTQRKQFLITDYVYDVVAYDLESGQELARFNNPDRLGPVNFIVSSDDSKVIVFTDESADWSSYTLQPGVTIWDRDTLTSAQINVDHYAAASRDHIALSQDNRYLVIGDDALRIWDIQHLPERVEDRVPIYRHGGPKTRIWRVRFSDWGVIETTSAEGIQHWDLHTGEYIPGA